MVVWKAHVHVLSLSVASGGKNVVQLRNTSGLTQAVKSCPVLAKKQTGRRYLWCGVVLGGGGSLFSTEKPAVISTMQQALSGAG